MNSKDQDKHQQHRAEKEYTLVLEETNTSLSDSIWMDRDDHDEKEKNVGPSSNNYYNHGQQAQSPQHQPVKEHHDIKNSRKEKVKGKKHKEKENSLNSSQMLLRNVTTRLHRERTTNDGALNSNRLNGVYNIESNEDSAAVSLNVEEKIGTYSHLDRKRSRVEVEVDVNPVVVVDSDDIEQLRTVEGEEDQSNNTFISEGVLNYEAISSQLRIAADKIAERDETLKSLTDRFETVLKEKSKSDSDAQELADKVLNLEAYLDKVLEEREHQPIAAINQSKSNDHHVVCPGCSLNISELDSTFYKTIPCDRDKDNKEREENKITTDANDSIIEFLQQNNNSSSDSNNTISQVEVVLVDKDCQTDSLIEEGGGKKCTTTSEIGISTEVVIQVKCNEVATTTEDLIKMSSRIVAAGNQNIGFTSTSTETEAEQTPEKTNVAVGTSPKKSISTSLGSTEPVEKSSISLGTDSTLYNSVSVSTECITTDTATSSETKTLINDEENSVKKSSIVDKCHSLQESVDGLRSELCEIKQYVTKTVLSTKEANMNKLTHWMSTLQEKHIQDISTLKDKYSKDLETQFEEKKRLKQVLQDMRNANEDKNAEILMLKAAVLQLENSKLTIMNKLSEKTASHSQRLSPEGSEHDQHPASNLNQNQNKQETSDLITFKSPDDTFNNGNESDNESLHEGSNDHLTRTNLEYLKLTHHTVECIDDGEVLGDKSELSISVSEHPLTSTNSSIIDDLKLQIADLEKKFESNKKYLNEQSIDRENERDEHQRIVNELEEKIEDLKKDKDRLTQIMYQQKSELEDNEARLRDAMDLEQELVSKSDKNEDELKSAVEKIFELREIIRDLEDQIDSSTQNVECLKKQNRVLSEELDKQVQLQREQDILQTSQTTGDTQQSDLTELSEELNCHINDLTKRVERKLVEMENFNWSARPNSSCSSTNISVSTEDISARELSNLHRERFEDDQEIGFALSSGLRRLDSHFENMVRFEDVLMKKLRDTELNFNLSRKRQEELETERKVQLEKLESQIVKISELESRLEQYRFGQCQKQNAETLSGLKTRVQNLSEELSDTQDKLHLKNIQYQDLEFKLESNKAILAKYYDKKDYQPKFVKFNVECQTICEDKVKISSFSQTEREIVPSTPTQTHVFKKPVAANRSEIGVQTIEKFDHLDVLEISSIPGGPQPTHSTPYEELVGKRIPRRTLRELAGTGDDPNFVDKIEEEIRSPEVFRDRDVKSTGGGGPITINFNSNRERIFEKSTSFDGKDAQLTTGSNDADNLLKNSMTSVRSAAADTKSYVSKKVQTPPLSLTNLIKGLDAGDRKKVISELKEYDEDNISAKEKEEIVKLNNRIRELEDIIHQQNEVEVSEIVESDEKFPNSEVDEILKNLESDTNLLLDLSEKEKNEFAQAFIKTKIEDLERHKVEETLENQSPPKMTMEANVQVSSVLDPIDKLDWKSMEKEQSERLRGLNKQIDAETLRTQVDQLYGFLMSEREKTADLHEQLNELKNKYPGDDWKSILNSEKEKVCHITNQLANKVIEMDSLKKTINSLEREISLHLVKEEKLEFELRQALLELENVQQQQQDYQNYQNQSQMAPKATGNEITYAQKKADKYSELYMRTKSYRKALAWQKKYLLVVVEGYKDVLSVSGAVLDHPYLLQKEICLTPGAIGRCQLDCPKTRFRIVVRAVMASIRFKYMVHRWQNKFLPKNTPSSSVQNTRPSTFTSNHHGHVKTLSPPTREKFAASRLRQRRGSNVSESEREIEEPEGYYNCVPSSSQLFESAIKISALEDGVQNDEKSGTVLSVYLERFENLEKDIGRTIGQPGPSSRNSSRLSNISQQANLHQNQIQTPHSNPSSMRKVSENDQHKK